MARLARPVPVVLVALVVAMMATSLASLVAPGTERIPERPSVVDFLAVSVVVAAFTGVGYAVVTRRPSNPVGWLFLSMALAMAVATFTTEYADRVVHAGAHLPAPSILAWLSTWLWTSGPLLALPLSIIVFPEGRLPSRRWRLPLMAAVALPLTGIVATAVAPGPLMGYEDQFENPFGARGPVGAAATALVASAEFGLASFVVPGLFAVVTTLVRMRRARNAERQQLKWLLYPVALFVTGIGLAFATQSPWTWSLALVSFAAIPVCAGIAILRYRLYEIDLVIRRTLVYGLVVAVLAAVYVGLVLAMQALLSGVTGGGPLPVALSTLATAALFGPVRRRVRAFVDLRFYRSHYDAQRTLDGFTARLRDEVDLPAVGSSLLDVAARTVQPHGASVWLRVRR